ncbi:MAG TPA: glycosyltransferase family 4 protein [Methylomirabilota bacterium]|jgi:UDP-glucose:(heptosyl)LPS alpha-1,3-glucosyltransferase|nr:glycosyltransferase family 4 protein [Methylomirabilota bacterium]
MKILIIARPYVFHGGVESATLGLMSALVAHGHDVHRAGPGQQPAHKGVTEHSLFVPPLPSAARGLALALAAARIARRGGWDVVQSHERTLVQDIYRAGEGCHRAYLEAMGTPPGRRLHHAATLALERRVFARTPEIVAISRRGAEEIAHHYAVPPARLSVAYNGVDLERFHPRLRARFRDAARAEAGVPAGAFTALFAGSGFERKGLATAIRALARLADRGAWLLVLGRGNESPYRRLAAELGVAARVAWLGPRPDIERWYAAADALALPTRYEPFGNVHLEALASGLPVVTTLVAGGAEAVSGRCGAVVAPEDPDALAAALDTLRAHNSAELRDAARDAALPFTFARQVATLEGVYRRVGRNR